MGRLWGIGVRDEAGVALILAVLLLLMISGIGIAAITHSGDDASLAGSTRRSTVTFYGADAGIQYAINQVRQSPPATDPFSFALADGTTLRSGDRSAGSAQSIPSLGSGPPPDGACINIGASCYRRDLYRATVSAFGAAASAAELEAQLAVVRIGTGGYR
jgi:hypothetical protein